jgi:peptidoglycan-N-acetylglucosamine deacetylase
MKQILKSIVDRIFLRRRSIRAGHAVLLTFDDGPDPIVTPQVLERLNAYNARAIFFIVGNRIPKAPELVPKILAAGHLLGNHSYSHWLEKEPGPVAYFRDVKRCQNRLRELTGQTPRLYRAPLGRSSVSSLVVPPLLGLRQVLWSQDEGDWMLRNRDDADALGRRLAAKIKSGDIVLLHDDNPYVIAVLDALLPQLKHLGFDLAMAVNAC